MKITGDLKPIAAYEFTYKVTLDYSLTKERSFTVTSSPTAAYFKLANGKWTTFIDVTCAPKASDFSVTLIWVKELDATLIATDKTGESAPARLDVKVTCEKCTLKVEPSEVKLGNEIKCNGELSRGFTSGYDVKSEWRLSNDLLEKKGNPTFGQKNIITQNFKALKIGRTQISTTVLVLDISKNFYFEFNKGNLDVEVKSPYSVTTDYASNFANKNTILSYRLNGLINNPSIPESINWWCSTCGTLTSGQGMGLATFKITSEGSLFEVAAIVTVNGQELRTSANKKIWIGVPFLDGKVEKVHTIDAGNALTLQLTEFAHYTGNIEYSIEAGLRDKIAVERIAADQFKIKSSHPKISADTIQLKFVASNICGSVSNVHTIHVEAAPGSSFDKPIELTFSKDHNIYLSPLYDYKEYGGELESFKLYLAFSLVHKADFNTMSAYFGFANYYQAFKIYDKDKIQRYACTPSTGADFRIEEMLPGRYYWVVEVQRDSKDSLLQIKVDGVTRGSTPTSPYVVDVLDPEFDFNDIRDTTTYSQEFRYTNEKGEEVRSSGGNNIYYVMKLEQALQLLIHTGGSNVCTEMYIMKGEPFAWKVFYHDEGSVSLDEVKNDLDLPQDVKDIIKGGQTCVRKIFEPGEYRLIFNGIKKTNSGVNNGLVSVNVLGRIIKGQTFDDAYELGHYGEREFNITQVYHDMQGYIKHGITRLFYHFSFDRNIDLYIKARSSSSYLPVELYNAKRELIASSESNGFYLHDLLGNNFYISIQTIGALSGFFDLELGGNSRGRFAQNDSYDIGSYNDDFTFTDCMDTLDGKNYELFKYKDINGVYQYAPASEKHIYYKIELLRPMKLSIDTEGSKVYTEFFVMVGDPYDWKIFYHFKTSRPDEKPLVELPLLPGKYRFVFNGVKLSNGGIENGLININVSGTVI